jgi:hypothetical protein
VIAAPVRATTGKSVQQSVSEAVLADAVRAVAAAASGPALAPPGRSPTDLGETLGTDPVTPLEVLLADEPSAPVAAVDDLAPLADLTEAGDAHVTA